MTEGRFSVKRIDGIDNPGLSLQECNGSGSSGVGPATILGLGGGGVIRLDSSPAKRKKSIVQQAIEALPRLENYRNSKRSKKRPSIGELHGGEDTVKDVNLEEGDIIQSDHHGVKLGWIQGVLIPCLLNIWGVMLFLRLSWVVGQSGMGESLIIIGISAVVCVITTLSLSAICTNGEVKGGGIYYIISRSLGPEFGASVGIVFAFANAVAASMNTIGFCDSLNDLLRNNGLKIVDGGLTDTRIVGVIALLIMVIICAVGMEWESKAQNFLVAIIAGAIVDFIIGTAMGPSSDEEKVKGFAGFSSEVFSKNWHSDYRRHLGIDYNFFQVFAIFFPSVTGIQAGANISGDLKDPASSIPKGTLLSLLISMISYILFVFFAGGAAMRDANGEITDLINGTVVVSCIEAQNCEYGLMNSYSVMQLMSVWGPFIYAGCFAATLSTALTNLLSVPRLIQALGIDRIYPGLIFFSKGYGKHGEPYRGYVLTFLISSAFVLIADLNAIAPLISNFYLASYALINFCTFHAALIKPLGWRPTFKYYNTWLSLFGFFLCVVIMFLINWQWSLITFIVILALYLIVMYRKPDVNWGSSTQAQTYKSALTICHRLTNVNEHVKNYEPQILTLCGSPQNRPPLLDFANMVTKNNSLLIVGEIVDRKLAHRARSDKRRSANEVLRQNKIKAFYSSVDNIDFETGAKALMQAAGIGKLSPNVLLMGYKNDWRTCNTKELTAYFNILHAAFDNRMAVAILRLKDGLDYGRLTEDDEIGYQSTDLTLTQPPSRSEPGARTFAATLMMHADSDLSLQQIGVGDSVTAQSQGARSQFKRKKKTPMDKILFTSSTGKQLPKFVLDNMSVFKNKQGKGTIDVWWMYDDGGLTMLLPYIIASRSDWIQCKLRVFALANNTQEIETEYLHMKDLLKKFRLKFFSLHMVELNARPRDDTIQFFENIIDDFRTSEEVKSTDCKVSEIEIAALQEKTHRHLRLRELLLENSKEAKLVVMSLPMPRRGTVSAPLYMSWLEILTKDLPPYLLVRGNQQSVLTFYS